MHQSNVPAGPASAPRTLRQLAMAVASALALLAPVPIASACPACRCGDPSWMLDGAGGTTSATWTLGLVVLGNRTTHGLESTGQAIELDRRASLLVGRSLAHGHSVTLTSHYVHRIVEDVSGGRTSTFAFGDLDLRGQFRLARGNTPLGFTTAGVSAALGIPTGPRLRDDDPYARIDVAERTRRQGERPSCRVLPAVDSAERPAARAERAIERSGRQPPRDQHT